ncbi:group XIIA secretory phospholipase A2-like [Oppia nitens]|uniref:group XIIA secretory phospholipase A2-like n=1 Tax=Oppia nitens TaxID=1686743 RepID=UPI0023DBD6B8|nr:group XIIA secretory phospholipase A2-like [Oppia nitens]
MKLLNPLTTNLSSIVQIVITVLLLSLPFGNAFVENFGKMFGDMGDSLSGFVDKLYTNVDSWADHIIEHAKGEECHFLCPHTKIAVTNKAYEHLPTGCQTFGIKIKESDLPIKEMRHCCNDHQLCYHKCGADKNQCDDQFGKCLVKNCRDTQKDEALFKGCRTATKLLMMSFLTFGCKNFKESQKNACVCATSDEL